MMKIKLIAPREPREDTLSSPFKLQRDNLLKVEPIPPVKRLAGDTRSETGGITKPIADSRRATDRVREEQRRLARFGELTADKTGQVRDEVLTLPPKIAALMPKPPTILPPQVTVTTTVNVSANSLTGKQRTYTSWSGSSRTQAVPS